MTKKEKAKQIIELLHQRYPNVKCALTYQHPYQLLLATRLSAQCTDKRVNIVTKILFDKYKTLTDLANAKIDDVISIVKPCGLGNTKGKDLVHICQKLLSDFDGKVPNTMEKLLTLPGVGRKTANLILGDIYHQPAVITDTHLLRITYRLGLINTKKPYEAEIELKKILPPEDSTRFCHCVVWFGREVCTARKPSCDNCELLSICAKRI